MKSVGVRGFRDHATKYLASGEALAVERDGRVIGLYFPVRADKAEARRALDRIEVSVGELLAQTGMAPEEFAKAFETGSAGDGWEP
jgi:cation transport regulator ChaC